MWAREKGTISAKHTLAFTAQREPADTISGYGLAPDEGSGHRIKGSVAGTERRSCMLAHCQAESREVKLEESLLNSA